MSKYDEIFDKARASLLADVEAGKTTNRIPTSYLEPINDFLKHFLPDEFKNKSYAEIAYHKDASGNYDGIEAIRTAWDSAVTFMNTRSAMTDYKGEQFKKAVTDIATLASGGGTFDNQFQNFMIGFDKYHASKLPAHIELAGPTFITRPRLCFQSSNLRNNVKMLPLDTANSSSLAFAIRWLLDSNLCFPEGANSEKYSAAASNCPLINPESPWLTPMCNAVTAISGFPDFSIQPETTDGGYFAEAQTYAKGADDFSRSNYSISVSFREIPGGVIGAMLFYWLEYIRCVTRGIMMAYPDDVDGQIMNYTVSIYQFNMDPSYQYITRWVKCTGCFPTTLDFGSLFSKSEGQYAQEAAQKLSTTFLVNKVEYMNPQCLMDFNTLAMRYCPDINLRGASNTNASEGSPSAATPNTSTGQSASGLKRIAIPFTAFSNFCGLPYITSDPHGYKLVYRESKRDIFNDPMVRKLIACDVARNEKEWAVANIGTNRYTLYQKYNYDDFYASDVSSFKAKYNPFSFDKFVDDVLNGTI